MTAIEIVKVDKRSPCTFSFKTSYSQENYKNVVLNDRRKTKPAAAQLVLHPAYCKKLPIEDKNKADILDLYRKNHIPKFYVTFWAPISIICIIFKVLFVIFLFCFFLNYDNNVIINVRNNLIYRQHSNSSFRCVIYFVILNF